MSMERRAAASPHPRIAGRTCAAAALAAAAAVLLAIAPAAATAAQEPAAGAARSTAAASVTHPVAPASAICDSTTALTAIGIDTDSGLALFALAGPGGGAGSWIVALDAGEAHAWPERKGGHFGGSVGPGPVLALEGCGPECVQAVRFDHGAWQPLGEPLTLPAASTVATTYDTAGAPWLVAHTAAAQEGQVQAFAFRYEGRAWKSRGSLAVTAVGQPQAAPAPQRRDGVVSGTGLFTASDPPSTWVLGLPGVAPSRRGQLLTLTGGEAAYLSGDGVAYLSPDAGKTWRRSTWTPWGSGDTTGMWRQGTDYVIDLPVGDHYGALQLAWYDRRSPAAERVVLTRLGAGGTWTELAAAPVDVTSRNGEHLPVTQALIPRADTWILLSGCAATATGSGLVLRTFEKGQLSEPRFLPIVLEPKTPPSPPPAPRP
jgi:hypothetical protein